MKFSNPSNRVFIYSPGQASNNRRFGDTDINAGTYIFEYAPLVSVSTSVVFDKTQSTYDQGTPSTGVVAINTITLTGYMRNSGVSVPEDQCSGILASQSSLRGAVTANKYFNVEINDGQGVNLQTFTDCSLVSLDFPPGTYASYGEFTLVVEQIDTSRMSNELYHTDYNWNIDIQENQDMGYLNTSNNNIAYNYYLTGTETVTVSTNGLTISATSYAIRQALFRTSASTIYLRAGNLYDVQNQTGTQYGVYNLKYNSSVNVTDSTATYSATFILVPLNGVSTIGLAQISTTYESSQGEAVGRLTASVLGLRRGIAGGDAVLADNAMTCISAIESNAISLINSEVSAGIPTNQTANGMTKTKNLGTGTGDLAIDYKTVSHQVSNVVYERIEVTTSPTRHIYATIPVMGRGAGPVLQDTGAFTEKTRDFMIEVVYKPGYGDSSGPGTIAVQNSWEPTGTVFESSNSYTWNPSERRFIRRKSWVYT